MQADVRTNDSTQINKTTIIAKTIRKRAEEKRKRRRRRRRGQKTEESLF